MRVATIDAMGCASVHKLPSATDANVDAAGPAKKRARRDGDITDTSSYVAEACQGIVLRTGGSHGAGGYGATARGWGDTAFRYVWQQEKVDAHRPRPFTHGALGTV